MSIKAILIDHDGTLVDSEPAHFQMWKNILNTYGVKLSKKEYKQFYAGVPTSTNAIEMVKRYSAIDVDASVLEEEKNVATRRFLSNNAFPLMVGAKEIIEYFKGIGMMVGIVTGAKREGVDATIQENGFEELLSVIVSGEDVKQSKPSPDVYLLAMDKLGVDSSECIAIEDTESGSKAAVKANIPCLAVPSAMSKTHQFEKALGVFENLEEAKNWIAQHYFAYA